MTKHDQICKKVEEKIVTFRLAKERRARIERSLKEHFAERLGCGKESLILELTKPDSGFVLPSQSKMKLAIKVETAKDGEFKVACLDDEVVHDLGSRFGNPQLQLYVGDKGNEKHFLIKDTERLDKFIDSHVFDKAVMWIAELVRPQEEQKP